jgi:hypothetical protein
MCEISTMMGTTKRGTKSTHSICKNVCLEVREGFSQYQEVFLKG